MGIITRKLKKAAPYRLYTVLCKGPGIIFLAFLIYSLFSSIVLADSETRRNTTQKTSSIELHFFWSHRCPHCLEAKPFVESVAEKYNWLTLKSYDLVNNETHVNRYVEMAGQLGVTAKSVPGFIFCGQILTGFNDVETTGKELEQKLIDCHENRKIKQHEFDLPLIGKVHYMDFSLPVFTVIIAALDAFNPCAFFVLFFLLSLIVHHRSRLRIALIGGIFVFFSGLMYFVFMAAWLNLFLLTEQLSFITAIAGAIAIAVGIINIKDYFFFKQGISLSIPDSAHPGLFQRMRNLAQAGSWPPMIMATILLAVVANSYELLCTAGLPMVYTRILTLNHLAGYEYYLYLALYNLIYIMPLLLIVTLFAITLGSKKLSEKQGRLLKLLSGGMMLGLGWVLLWAPELLNNMLVSLGIIIGAIALTALFAMLECLKK